MSLSDPCLIRSRGPSGEPVVRLGMPLVDDYLEFLTVRCRPNTVLAAAYDLKVFFTVVGKPPAEVVRGGRARVHHRPAHRRGRRRDVLQPVDAETSGGVATQHGARGGCRSSRGSSRTCRPAATSPRTRCRAGCRPVGSGRVPGRGCR